MNTEFELNRLRQLVALANYRVMALEAKFEALSTQLEVLSTKNEVLGHSALDTKSEEVRGVLASSEDSSRSL